MSNQVHADIGLGSVIGHAIIWFLIILITFGIGIFFYPYAFVAFILNRTTVRRGDEVGRFKCNISIGGQIGHIIIWAIISVLTFGLGYIFYAFNVWEKAMNETEIVWE